MAKQKSVAREPMLYITQPEFQAAKPRMQSTYRSVPEDKVAKQEEMKEPKSKEETNSTSQKKERSRSWEKRNKAQDKFGLKTSEVENVKSKKQSVWDTDEKEETETEEPESVEEEVQETEEDEDSEQERPRVSFSNRKRRDRFKDMNLEEKVEYFVNLPSSVPRMKCEVFTGEKSYRGWIQDYQDGVVSMKILQRPFRVEIPFDSIESIELKGF
ncbi:CotO family spore coat protein [Pontibacillus sp. HMF3514]|uniref:CotO family spore coat protein n=1 Tax=Pontibacillus sp. HMF3514 TaxID=2692425 RepID=UPI00131FCC3A|nr:CotO family spore coat protein [Pontibacillus sp. HMF3514]QHE51479.1 hypothetical protein GS400_05275 [Pontibacillus sp. HMF3514]